jgi:molybdopterin biosynthesis enzyme
VHVRVRAECGRLVAEVLDNQCSSLVGNAARANALVLLPPGERVYGDGELVTITLIAPLGAAGGALPHRSVA